MHGNGWLTWLLTRVVVTFVESLERQDKDHWSGEVLL